MRINSPKAIAESEEDLTELEQRLRGQKAADRVRMLRLLKSGTVTSMKDCAPLLGYSLVQLTRLQGTLPDSRPGRAHQAAETSRADVQSHGRGVGGLDGRDAQGHMATMEDARDYLEREWGIRYKNGKSLWWLFKKLRVKWKTGRRRHKKANAEQQTAFKKTSEP